MFREPSHDPRLWFISHDLELRKSNIEGAGTGVFAINDIPARTIIEKSPVIIVGREIFDHLNDFNGTRNILCDYPFHWPHGGCAFALGWGGMYNHSFDPNTQWFPHTEPGEESLCFITKKDIKAGEEIFVRYTWNADKLWFVDENIEMGNNEPPGSRMSMGLKTSALFSDMRRIISADQKGQDIETLSDYKMVSKNSHNKPENSED